MSSLIDATVPADNVKADKALFRSNFQIAKDEITDLQNTTSVPRMFAMNDTESLVENMRAQIISAQGDIVTINNNVTNIQADIRVPYRMAYDDAQFRTA